MVKHYCSLFNRRVFQTTVLGLTLLLSWSAAGQAALRVHGSVVVKGLLDPSLDALGRQCGRPLELVGNGAENGLLDLMQGRAEVAMLSAPLETIVQKINARNPGMISTNGLQSLPLGVAKIVLVVNPRNPVRHLSAEQATGLLTGRITNWKEVGGQDQAVVVVTPAEGNGTRATVESQLLKGAGISPMAQTVSNPGLVRFTVGQMPRAIGFLGAGLITDKVSVVACETQISSEVSLVVRGAVSQPVQNLAAAVRPLIR